MDWRRNAAYELGEFWNDLQLVSSGQHAGAIAKWRFMRSAGRRWAFGWNSNRLKAKTPQTRQPQKAQTSKMTVRSERNVAEGSAGGPRFASLPRGDQVAAACMQGREPKSGAQPLARKVASRRRPMQHRAVWEAERNVHAAFSPGSAEARRFGLFGGGPFGRCNLMPMPASNLLGRRFDRHRAIIFDAEHQAGRIPAAIDRAEQGQCPAAKRTNSRPAKISAQRLAVARHRFCCRHLECGTLGQTRFPLNDNWHSSRKAAVNRGEFHLARRAAG